jgi:site-specific DNA-methyltransferase (adenine-specific)
MNNVVFNKDCMIGMAETPDKFYDLAIIDPNYGIGESGQTNKTRCKLAVSKDYGNKTWDDEPVKKETLNEIFRVSKNQIIWGANHFIERMPYDSSCWLVWDKDNGNTDFADCELAWTSFPTAVRIFKYKWQGMLQGNMKNKEERIHPTQKPVELYGWIYRKYAKPGMKILDTHVGSGSSRIAAYKYGLDFTGYEIDADYWNAQEKRFKIESMKAELFTPTLPPAIA